MHENDKKYYNELVDQALTQEPVYSLPDNFADILAEKAGRSFAWEQYLREFLIYLAVIAGAMLIVAAMALIWFQSDLKNWFDFLISNIRAVAGINILVIFILFADRVLLRYFLYRSDLKKEFS